MNCTSHMEASAGRQINRQLVSRGVGRRLLALEKLRLFYLLPASCSSRPRYSRVFQQAPTAAKDLEHPCLRVCTDRTDKALSTTSIAGKARKHAATD